MGLAAAEVGLQLDDGIAALAGQAAHGPGQHASQALGQVGAAEELGRVPVFIRAFAQMHLPEVGGELGLLVAAACHVRVGRHDLPPGLQVGGDRTLDRQAGLAAALAPRLLVVAHPQQFILDLVDVVRLWGRYRGQQASGRIQDAVRVVTGEILLVRPLVAVPAQLADETALSRPKGVAKDIVPGVPHQLEQPRHVPLGNRLARQHGVVDMVMQLPASGLA